MRRKRKTDQEIIKEIVDKMFSIAGHNVTYEDVLGRKDQWYYDWDMTPEQEQQWMDWMVDLFQKEKGLSKEYARRSAAMYNLMWGLRVVHLETKQSGLECKFGFDSCANNQLAMCEKCDDGENYEIKQKDMNNKKETSLDFFFQQISEKLGFESEVYEYVEKILEQAKSMHKEEIIEAYREGRTDQQSSSDSFYNRNAESYYNEKFGDE
jgi:hypothetical protein